MRLDPLQQYAKLHKQLTEEKGQLESRLNQINQVLRGERPPAQIAPSSLLLTEVPARPRRIEGEEDMDKRSPSTRFRRIWSPDVSGLQ